MNKTIIKEALKSGIKLEGNHFVFNSNSVDINKFLHEVTKIHFTHSLPESVGISKEKLFQQNNKVNRRINE